MGHPSPWGEGACLSTLDCLIPYRASVFRLVSMLRTVTHTVNLGDVESTFSQSRPGRFVFQLEDNLHSRGWSFGSCFCLFRPHALKEVSEKHRWLRAARPLSSSKAHFWYGDVCSASVAPSGLDVVLMPVQRPLQSYPAYFQVSQHWAHHCVPS